MKEVQKNVMYNDIAGAAGEEMHLMPLDTNVNDSDNDDDSGLKYDNDTLCYLGSTNSSEDFYQQRKGDSGCNGGNVEDNLGVDRI